MENRKYYEQLYRHKFEKLAEMSYEHEMKAKAGDRDFVNNNFSDLEKEFIRIKMSVQKYLNSKKR